MNSVTRIRNHLTSPFTFKLKENNKNYINSVSGGKERNILGNCLTMRGSNLQL
jgi:hypothetical protein